MVKYTIWDPNVTWNFLFCQLSHWKSSVMFILLTNTMGIVSEFEFIILKPITLRSIVHMN